MLGGEVDAPGGQEESPAGKRDTRGETARVDVRDLAAVRVEENLDVKRGLTAAAVGARAAAASTAAATVDTNLRIQMPPSFVAAEQVASPQRAVPGHVRRLRSTR
jgi:hypothetical protein